MSALEPYQVELIDKCMKAGALKFGTFTLKSGRISPYFFNAGMICTGSLIHALSTAYAAVLAPVLSAAESGSLPFDVLFGPAYKGISIAACTAQILYATYGIDIAYAYDRKEAKDHGEGGRMVGAPVAGKRVLVIDDVMTAGTAVRLAISLVKEAGGEVVAVAMCLDREEVGKDGVTSSIRELEAELGGEGSVRTILRMRDLIVWLEGNGMNEDVERMKAYREQYGVKASA